MKEHEGFAFQAECSEASRAAIGKAGSAGVRRATNWNVTSTTSFDAVVLDRVHTTPGAGPLRRAAMSRGQPTFDAETINGDYDGDGDIDSSDDSSFTTCKNGSQPVTGACRTLDFDNDGDVDASDQTTFDTLYPGSTEIYRQPARSTSANGFAFAHQGLMIDEESTLYYNRHRQYNANQQRFVQRDRVDTTLAMLSPNLPFNMTNVYSYVDASPSNNTDPTGLAGRWCCIAIFFSCVSESGCLRECLDCAIRCFFSGGNKCHLCDCIDGPNGHFEVCTSPDLRGEAHGCPCGPCCGSLCTNAVLCESVEQGEQRGATRQSLRTFRELRMAR